MKFKSRDNFGRVINVIFSIKEILASHLKLNSQFLFTELCEENNFSSYIIEDEIKKAKEFSHIHLFQIFKETGKTFKFEFKKWNFESYGQKVLNNLCDNDNQFFQLYNQYSNNSNFEFMILDLEFSIKLISNKWYVPKFWYKTKKLISVEYYACINYKENSFVFSTFHNLKYIQLKESEIPFEMLNQSIKKMSKELQ